MVGSVVAQKTGLKLGDTFRPTHDVAGQSKHKHRPFTVVGILEPTGTPNDRALFVNIEGFYGSAGTPATCRPLRATRTATTATRPRSTSTNTTSTRTFPRRRSRSPPS